MIILCDKFLKAGIQCTFNFSYQKNIKYYAINIKWDKNYREPKIEQLKKSKCSII